MAFLPVTEPRAGHAAFDIEKRGVVEIGKEKKGMGSVWKIVADVALFLVPFPFLGR